MVCRVCEREWQSRKSGASTKGWYLCPHISHPKALLSQKPLSSLAKISFTLLSFFSGLTLKSTETFRIDAAVSLRTAGGGKKCAIVVSQVLVSCFLLLLKPESACYSSVSNYAQRHTPQAKTQAAAQTAHTENTRWIVGGRLQIFTAVCVSVSQSDAHDRHLCSSPC